MNTPVVEQNPFAALDALSALSPTTHLQSSSPTPIEQDPFQALQQLETPTPAVSNDPFAELATVATSVTADSIEVAGETYVKEADYVLPSMGQLLDKFTGGIAGRIGKLLHERKAQPTTPGTLPQTETQASSWWDKLRGRGQEKVPLKKRIGEILKNPWAAPVEGAALRLLFTSIGVKPDVVDASIGMVGLAASLGTFTFLQLERVPILEKKQRNACTNIRKVCQHVMLMSMGATIEKGLVDVGGKAVHAFQDQFPEGHIGKARHTLGKHIPDQQPPDTDGSGDGGDGAGGGGDGSGGDGHGLDTGGGGSGGSESGEETDSAPVELPPPVVTETHPSLPDAVQAPTGATVSGSLVDAAKPLTYEGHSWQLLSNGVDNTLQLLSKLHQAGSIDQTALASKLQEATDLWSKGQLDKTTHSDLWNVFHLSNGTESVYNNIQNTDTLKSLQALGIVK